MTDFLIRCFTVSVIGYGDEVFFCANRGKALAEAWRSDAFCGVKFGDFLKIASARTAIPPENFGDRIYVQGRPAFLVERMKHGVRFAYPGQTAVFNSHPADVSPHPPHDPRHRIADRHEGVGAAHGHSTTLVEGHEHAGR